MEKVKNSKRYHLAASPSHPCHVQTVSNTQLWHATAAMILIYCTSAATSTQSPPSHQPALSAVPIVAQDPTKQYSSTDYHTTVNSILGKS